MDSPEAALRVLADADLGEAPREPLATHARVPPWDAPTGVEFAPRLLRPVRKKDPAKVVREAAIETLAQHAPDLDANTDGSVLDPIELSTGGGGYTMADASGVVHQGRAAAGRRCNSYRAELRAVAKLADDLIAGRDEEGRPIAFPPGPPCSLRVCLDSQSAIVALSRGPHAQRGALEMLVWDRLLELRRTRCASILIQYVPGHVGLEQQVESDTVAKEAARTCEQAEEGLSQGLAKCVLRLRLRDALVRALREQEPQHLWLRSTGGKTPKDKCAARGLQRQLSQLRAGRCGSITRELPAKWSNMTRELEIPGSGRHGLSLGPHRHGPAVDPSCCIVTAVAARSAAARAEVPVGVQLVEIDGEPAEAATADAALRALKGSAVKLKLSKSFSTCPGCWSARDGTEHLLRCPAYVKPRMEIFGSPTPPLTVLSENAAKVAEYLRRIGRATDATGKRRSPAPRV